MHRAQLQHPRSTTDSGEYPTWSCTGKVTFRMVGPTEAQQLRKERVQVSASTRGCLTNRRRMLPSLAAYTILRSQLPFQGRSFHQMLHHTQFKPHAGIDTRVSVVATFQFPTGAACESLTMNGSKEDVFSVAFVAPSHPQRNLKDPLGSLALSRTPTVLNFPRRTHLPRTATFSAGAALRLSKMNSALAQHRATSLQIATHRQRSGVTTNPPERRGIPKARRHDGCLCKPLARLTLIRRNFSPTFRTICSVPFPWCTSKSTIAILRIPKTQFAKLTLYCAGCEQASVTRQEIRKH